MQLRTIRNVLLVLAAGAMPLGSVATCDFGPGGGQLFYDHWDDDDVYLPWALSASVAALKVAPWSRPSLVLHERADGKLRQHKTGGLFHGGWAYTRDAFQQASGYPPMNNGEDQAFAGRLRRAAVRHADPCSLGFMPFYLYRWGPDAGYHLSGMGPKGYQELGRKPAEKATLKITWPRDFRNVTILPGIQPRVF